jgi:hypothetical protein
MCTGQRLLCNRDYSSELTQCSLPSAQAFPSRLCQYLALLKLIIFLVIRQSLHDVLLIIPMIIRWHGHCKTSI